MAGEQGNLHPTLQNIVDQASLKWVFVGGKGGVGKTSCSCALATILSKKRKSVLIISTDPAHNISDAFDQKFTRVPTLIQGFDNLYAMEIDPTAAAGANSVLDDDEDDALEQELNLNLPGTSSSDDLPPTLPAAIKRKMQQFTQSLPGVDEFMTYTEVLRLVRKMDFGIVLFDTAPTGHTLRLLSFPEMMEKAAGKFMAIKNRFGPMISQVSNFFGFGGMDNDAITSAVEERLPFMKQITSQFRDPEQTTFICVCIPEYLSMYETERLVQELAAQEMDVHNIVVNQLLCPPTINDPACTMCSSRRTQQKKYVEQILELYDDMHVVLMPALLEEIRGVSQVKSFSKFMIEPHKELNDLFEISSNP